MPRKRIYEETILISEYKTDGVALQFSYTWNWSGCHSESIKQVQNVLSSFAVTTYQIDCLVRRVAFFPNSCCLKTEFNEQAIQNPSPNNTLKESLIAHLATKIPLANQIVKEVVRILTVPKYGFESLFNLP